MLRGAKSLPTLRVAYNQSVEAATRSAVETKVSTRYYSSKPINTIVYNAKRSTLDDINVGYRSHDYQMDSSIGKFKSFFKRDVHQTSKKQTILLDSDFSSGSKFSSMNVQGLKLECKKRGLKVSGRKLDLVQRISAFESQQQASSFSTSPVKREPATKRATAKKTPVTKKSSTATTKTAVEAPVEQSRPISTTTKTLAKGDNSTIDFFKVPQNPFPEPDGRPPMKVLSLSTKASLKQSDSHSTPEPVATKVEVGEDSKAPVAQGGSIITDKAGDKTGSGEEEISSKDKTFFGVFALLTLGWWSLKPKEKH